MRLKIEEPSERDIWGNLIDVEIKDDSHGLKVLETAKKHMKKKPKIHIDGKEVRKSLDELIDEVKRRHKRKEVKE